MKNYLFGIGTALAVLAVLAVFTVPVAAENTAYFVPQHSNATTDNSTYVFVYVDIDEGVHLAGGQIQVNFDNETANITKCSKNPDDYNYTWNNFWYNLGYTENGYMWNGVADPQCWDAEEGEWAPCPGNYITGPAHVKLCRYKVKAVGTPGESPFDFSWKHFPDGCSACQKCKLVDEFGVELDITWENGTFTHEGEMPSQTFTKSLPTGWNLISLPLTPSDNSVSAVLSGVSDVVYRYNATSKEFECPDTMDPGIGYFVHVTTPSTWEYEGTSESSTSTELKAGLNMIGVPNCTMSVGAAMVSTDYRYVARWNAADQKFEVYNPSAPVAFQHFDMMEAGEGYFVSAKSDHTPWGISCS